MRKLFSEFFYIPKHGKVSEKVMLARLATTITTVIICLAAMSITAYAYFSYNITSGSNIIKAANFETSVNIQITDENGEAIEVTKSSGTHVAELKANSTYYVTLRPTEKSTAKTGFVIVTAEGCDNKYHTQQLGKDGEKNTEAISFYLIPGADTKVTFLAHWGTSSYYGYVSDNAEKYIKQGETVQIPVNGAVGSTNQEEDSSKEPTTPATTTPTEVVHTVGSGETLWEIAEKYKTTVKRIASYNKIPDPNNIQAGKTLTIPPADWVMPEDDKDTSSPQKTEEVPPTVTTESTESTKQESSGTAEETLSETTTTNSTTETTGIPTTQGSK